MVSVRNKNKRDNIGNKGHNLKICSTIGEGVIRVIIRTVTVIFNKNRYEGELK